MVRMPMMTINFGQSAAVAAALVCALGVAPARAQVSASEIIVRLGQLENQVRQLTGMVEQLQYRNQRLEAELRRLQGGGAPAGSSSRPPPQQFGARQPPIQAQSPVYPPPAAGLPGRRSDAFDPSQNPNAPGIPRALGSTYASDRRGHEAGMPPRRPGAPLDLSGRATAAAGDPSYGGQGGLPPPPPRNPSATGVQTQMATLPPSQSPRDLYDLAYGYLIRKDFALAEQTFRIFLTKYPEDRFADDAQYGLGESFYRRRNYRDAANSFLEMTRKYDKSPRAPEALMRLGQSLAALKEKDLACGAFAEISRKYTRISPTVKKTVAREKKRVGC